MKKNRKIRIIFYVENWLWKSEFWPCKMCDSVQQKLGHTNVSISDMSRFVAPPKTWFF